jgi:hypothetical protein
MLPGPYLTNIETFLFFFLSIDKTREGLKELEKNRMKLSQNKGKMIHNKDPKALLLLLLFSSIELMLYTTVLFHKYHIMLGSVWVCDFKKCDLKSRF